MNLYGNDMDETVSPLESGLGWTVAWEPADRNFIGRPALETLRRDTGRRRFTGLLLEDRGVLRDRQRWWSTASAKGKSRPAVTRRR